MSYPCIKDVKCPFCGKECSYELHSCAYENYYVDCGCCGKEFRIVIDSVVATIEHIDEENKCWKSSEEKTFDIW